MNYYDLQNWQPEKKNRMPGRVPWSAWDVFAIVGLVIAVYLAIMIILGTLLAVVSIIDSERDIGDIVTSPIANSLMWLVQWSVTLGVSFTYLKLRGYQLDLGVIGFRRTGFLRAAGLVALVLFAALIIQGAYVQIIEPEQDPVTNLFGTSTVSFILAMIVVAILTPVVEELFFRGIIHQGLEQRFGFLPGALISSAIFAVAHIDPTVYIPIFALGFGFALLVSRTKSVWPSIIAHSLWNSMGVIAQFFLPDS